jgi:predicted amidohydrolase
LTAWYTVGGVPDVNPQVFACFTWDTDKFWRKVEHALPVAMETRDGVQWIRAEKTMQLPAEAEVYVELFSGWLEYDAAAYWGKVTVQQLPADYQPPARPVRVAVIDDAPPPGSTLEANADFYTGKIRDLCAGRAGEIDVVCLPEWTNAEGVRRSNLTDVAIDLKSSAYIRKFRDAARDCRVNVIASLIENDNGTLYNTALVIGRDGATVGEYRKTYLAIGEIFDGFGRGDELNLIETDFGRIGILICWDYYNTDPLRTLALQGAEMIFIPISGDARMVVEGVRMAEEHIGIATAIQNGVPVVFSNCKVNVLRGNRSMVIDQFGSVLARTDPAAGLHHAEAVVDLAKRDGRLDHFLMDRRLLLHATAAQPGTMPIFGADGTRFVPIPNTQARPQGE